MSDSPVEKSKRPYLMLDSWRGFAALWVVCYHTSLATFGRFSEQSNALAHMPVYAASMYGSLGVQMFFVISGYCIINAACKILERKQSIWVYIKARIKRIYPPFLAASVAGLLLAMAMAELVDTGVIQSSVLGSVDPMDKPLIFFIANLSLTQLVLHQPFVIIPCWTLCYEVAFYLIVGLVLAFAPILKTTQNLLNILHAFTCGLVVMLIAMPVSAMVHIYPFDLWPEFGLGIIVFDVLKNSSENRPKIWFGIALALFAVFAWHRSEQIGAYNEPSRMTFIFTAIFAIAVVALYKFDEKISKWPVFRWLGAIGIFSYSLYLTHTLCIGFVFQIFTRLGAPESLNLLVFVGVIACAIGCGYAFYTMFERPFMTKDAVQRKSLEEELTKGLTAEPAVPVVNAVAE